MRILLKLELDCTPDAAWRALHSSRAIAELYGPLIEMVPLEAQPATSLESGADVPVQLRALGALDIGRQLIHVEDRYTEDSHGPVRILRDSGIPLTGPLSQLDVWDHQMAVSAVPGHPDKTLWRDRLVIGGIAAGPLWPLLWATWQYRAMRLRALAPTWSYEPEPTPDAASTEAANTAATTEPAAPRDGDGGPGSADR
ncbi:hypothetical protein BKA24_002990 [Microbacterium marinum]|uniref:SRPBCC family protein n=1 Tax=Microbacterium marinum TaxID=421115 RepID=A0A7W7BUY4_9MICO|nr:hypothetical protein [Microbacterium marinum]MBB4668281.1 hypothetical protein [Microbacterium marinum]